MFERLRRLLFRGRGEPQPEAPVAGPARADPFGVPFQADLPERLSHSHAALRSAFELAQDSERRGEPDRVLLHLEAFDALLRGYVAGPSNDFHGYMSERLSGDLPHLTTLRALRPRLRLLSREVHDLVHPRQAESGRSAPAHRTLLEWGTTLRDSLAQLESELVPLYRPPAERA